MLSSIPFSLMMDSSSALVWSAIWPGLAGGSRRGFALDHDVEVDELLGEGGHVVLEAEGVLPNGVGGEDIVALTLALAVKYILVVRVLDLEVNVEGAAGLNGEVELRGKSATGIGLGAGREDARRSSRQPCRRLRRNISARLRLRRW